MKEKNNIERLFQEKLNAFEVLPPEEAWQNIENQLKRKEDKRRIIPFWWKLSGIAALLAIGFGILNTFGTDSSSKKSFDTTNTSVSNTQKKEYIESSSSENSLKEKVVGKSTTDFVASDNSKMSVEESSSIETKKQKNTIIKNNASLAVHSSKNKTLKTPKSVLNPLLSNDSKTTLANNHPNKNTEIVTDFNIKENKTIAEAVPSATKTEKSSKLNQTENNTTETTLKKEDSTAIAKAELNAMEELLNEKEKKSTQKQKINRWAVTPMVAPIYFGSFSNGSPLDESLQSNPKNYNNSVSYGLGVNYSVSKKIKVRAGINVLSVDYDTEGIVFYQDTKAQMMKNINPTQQGSLIQIKPLANVNSQLDRVVSERFDGYLNQKMGYIEMPIEMTYKIAGRKLGLDLTGGFSTLFLNQNEIYLRSDGLNMKIGSATNLNNVHFSTNLGLGLNYAVFRNFDARIEPSFRYQISTFSSDSGSFKPYVFGIYSGISYKF